MAIETDTKLVKKSGVIEDQDLTTTAGVTDQLSTNSFNAGSIRDAYLNINNSEVNTKLQSSRSSVQTFNSPPLTPEVIQAITGYLSPERSGELNKLVAGYEKSAKNGEIQLPKDIRDLLFS
jgi:hypothetical protein